MSKRFILVFSLLMFTFMTQIAVAETILSAGANGIITYVDTSVGTALAAHRLWNSTVQNFTGAFNNSANVGGVIGQVDGAGVHERNEFVYGFQDTGGDINLQVFNGTNWTNLLEVTLGLTNANTRAFDIAVEDISGRVLIVYENTSTADNNIAYRLWNGTGYSEERLIDGLSGGGAVQWVRAVSRKGTNDVMIVTLDGGSDYFAVLWNGTIQGAQNNTKINLSLVGNSITTLNLDFAWEAQSGEGVVVYGEAGATRYRNFTGSSWSVQGTLFDWAALSAGTGGGSPLQNVLCSDSLSDYIGWIGIDNQNDVDVRIWNGSAVEPAPAAPTELTTAEPAVATAQQVSCAWETLAGRGLFSFIDAAAADDGRVSFVLYNKTAWSNSSLLSPSRSKTFDSGGTAIENHKLFSSPTTNEIMVQTASSGNDQLVMARWNGSSDWVQPTNTTMGVSCNQGADPSECFAFAWDEFDTVPSVRDENISPAVRVVQGQPVNISINVTDNVKIDNVTINLTLPNSTVLFITLSNRTSDIFNATTAQSVVGNYTVRFIANDTSTHQNINSSITTTFEVINLPPNVTGVNATPRTASSGAEINISANVTDFSIDVVIANITHPNGTVTLVVLRNATQNIFNGTFANTTAGGAYNVTIIANDTLGLVNNTERTNFTITVDSTLPAVFDARPSANSSFNVSDAIAVSVNVTDAVGIGVVQANITFPNTSTQVLVLLRNGTTDQFTNNFTVPNNRGQYNVTFFANDTSNNINNSVTTFFNIEDTVRPAVFDVRPSEGGSFNTLSAIAIAANVTDNGAVGIVTANITFPNASTTVLSLLRNTTTNQFTNNFTIPALDGRYNVSFFANDTVNNTNNSVTTFFLTNDTTRPSLVDVRPVANSSFNVSDVVEVAANVTDNALISVVNANITLPNTSTTVLALLRIGTTDKYANNFTAPNNRGQYNVTFFANDSSNNINNSVTTFFNVEDTVRPAAFDVRPSANSTFNTSDTVAVAVNATDNGVIDRVLANITFPNSSTTVASLLRNASTNQFTNNFTIPNLTGQYNITFIVNDTANNLNSSVTTFFNVNDVEIPRVFDVRPVANSAFNLSDVIAVSANVTDNVARGIVRANITFPNTSTVVVSLLRNGTTDQFTNNFTIPNVVGRYNISFFANDSANNINNSVATFFVTSETVVPSVFDVRPFEGDAFNSTMTIEVAANVTDNVNVSTVQSTVTFPNTSTQVLTLLRNGTTDQFVNNFTIPNVTGRYNVTFSATDSSGNVNNSAATFFRANDTVAPNIQLDQPSNDFQSNISAINFSFTPVDNFAVVLNCTIRVNGTAANNASALNGTLANFSLVIGEGAHVWNVSCTDGENNTNTSFNRNVTVDLTGPNFIILSTSPSDSAGLDPGAAINISANITDNLTSVSSAVFQFKESNDTEFTNRTMALNSTTGLWNATFTPVQNNTYNLRLFAVDAVGNSNFSAITNISVQTDRTWDRTPVAFAVSGNTSQNISVGDIVLNNTGDVALNFTVNGTNASFPFRFNVTFPLEIPAGQDRRVQVNFTAPSASDVFTFVLNISAEPNANPANRTTTVTVSTTGQPFLFAEFTTVPNNVTQGASGIIVSALLKNTGQANASNVTFSYALPSGWSITDGSQEVDAFVIIPGANLTSEITVSIASNAATGNQTIVANATGFNITGADLRTLGFIQEVSSTVEVNSVPVPIGKAAGGGGAASSGAGGAAAAGGAVPARIGPPALSINRTFFEEDFLTTAQVIEIVRGEKQSFPVIITNVYENTTMNAVGLSISGYLSQYLTSTPDILDGIGYKQKKSFTVLVAAPAYRSKGEYDMVFTIKGDAVAQQRVIEGSVVTTRTVIKEITETRRVKLIIHEASPKTAGELLNMSSLLVSALEQKGIGAHRAGELFSRLKEAYEQKDYARVVSLGKELQLVHDQAVEAANMLAHLKQKITDAEAGGIDVRETKKLFVLGRAAFEREDFALAVKRLKQASLVQLVEVAGVFNIARFVLRWWWVILFTFAIMLALTGFVMRRVNISVIAYRLKSLAEEEEHIVGLMADAQRTAFKEKSISITEYHKRVYLYEQRLELIKTLMSRLRTRRVALTSLQEELGKLMLEEKLLQNSIRALQELYFVKAQLSRVKYVGRIDELRTRLADIEGELAVVQTKIKEHPPVIEAAKFWQEFFGSEFWRAVAAQLSMAIVVMRMRLLLLLNKLSAVFPRQYRRQAVPASSKSAKPFIAQLKSVYKEHPTAFRPVCPILIASSPVVKQSPKSFTPAGRADILLKLKGAHLRDTSPLPLPQEVPAQLTSRIQPVQVHKQSEPQSTILHKLEPKVTKVIKDKQKSMNKSGIVQKLKEAYKL
ncbi:MAG: hypothetical protein HY363_00815 [Candidatus Aenigmarchaeota archaeon]|nr:hypothetical protein [Candidatus Aenigmarchaeota archaeon]